MNTNLSSSKEHEESLLKHSAHGRSQISVPAVMTGWEGAFYPGTGYLMRILLCFDVSLAARWNIAGLYHPLSCLLSLQQLWSRSVFRRAPSPPWPVGPGPAAMLGRHCC